MYLRVCTQTNACVYVRVNACACGLKKSVCMYVRVCIMNKRECGARTIRKRSVRVRIKVPVLMGMRVLLRIMVGDGDRFDGGKAAR